MRADKEHQAQKNLFTWARLSRHKYPELDWMFAIPNGGLRNVRVAVKLKAEGVRAGVPDIFLPIPRGGSSGLFIELKIKPNKITQKQSEWLTALARHQYEAVVAYGWEEAKEIIENYLNK